MDRVADYASAEKIRQKSYADALLTYAQAAWPAWVTYAKAQYAAAATWFGQVWHDYADYQKAIASAATALVTASAAPRIQYATDVATAWKNYNVTMAGIYVDRNNAAHAWHVAYVSSQPASDFAYIEPTENQSWWSWAWSGIVSFGTNLIVAVGLTVAAMALACYMPVAGAVLAVGGLVLLAANITAAAMTRYADGQSMGESILGGIGDSTPLGGLYTGITSQDIGTGQHLDLADSERASMFGGAIGDLAGVLLGSRFRLCFVAGTKVLMADDPESIAAVDAAFAQAGPNDEETSDAQDAAQWLVAGACVTVGVIGYDVFRRRRRQREESKASNPVDVVFAQGDSDWLSQPGGDDFSGDCAGDERIYRLAG